MSVDDYLQQMLALQPPGDALPTDLESDWALLLKALAEEFARADAMIEQLTTEILPSKTSALLPEYEEMLALPDLCTFDYLALEERVKAVHARFTASGGSNNKYWIDMAAAFGFTITIDSFLHIWRVYAPGQAQMAVAGAAVAGDPIREWGAEAVMECTFKKLGQSHARVDFAYT